MHYSPLCSLIIKITLVLLTLFPIAHAQTSSAAPETSGPPRPIDTAFDVQPASVLGGCSEDRKNDLSIAFDGMIQMKNLISIAAGDMSRNAELPATGWMFNYLFAIPSTQENLDYGDDRVDLQVDNLRKIWNLMDMIGQHSEGRIFQDAQGIPRRTRIYCGHEWIKASEYVIDPSTNSEVRPRRKMKGGGKLSYLGYPACLIMIWLMRQCLQNIGMTG
ncbi:hypothetical protein ONS95_010036 [Cadophora gregata]|uniref:uncharacterized protein n=1 Tax=Cadophora gregata TaxID=51156 RepID=UPI0026DAC4E5|nr:uncharacterized protein ONS95_010036 [Cadophora gregata]KAK0121750.1 hypothetical protein ONS95_010036 [Cadophora gregata]